LGAVANLASLEDNCSKLGFLDACSIVVEVMKVNLNVSLAVEKGCSAIENLSANAVNRTKFIPLKAEKVIAEGVKNFPSNPVVKEHGNDALRALAGKARRRVSNHYKSHYSMLTTEGGDIKPNDIPDVDITPSGALRRKESKDRNNDSFYNQGSGGKKRGESPLRDRDLTPSGVLRHRTNDRNNDSFRGEPGSGSKRSESPMNRRSKSDYRRDSPMKGSRANSSQDVTRAPSGYIPSPKQMNMNTRSTPTSQHSMQLNNNSSHNLSPKSSSYSSNNPTK
jgi:hypothetical protein